MTSIHDIKDDISKMDLVGTLHIYDFVTTKLNWINLLTLSPEDIGRDNLGDLTHHNFFNDPDISEAIDDLHQKICDFAERKLSND
jgi:hypothetical protein